VSKETERSEQNKETQKGSREAKKPQGQREGAEGGREHKDKQKKKKKATDTQRPHSLKWGNVSKFPISILLAWLPQRKLCRMNERTQKTAEKSKKK